MPIREEDVCFHSPEIGRERVVGLWGSGDPAEVNQDHWCCLNVPSAWLGEFPLRAPGYLKVKISTWEHVTGFPSREELSFISQVPGGRGGDAASSEPSDRTQPTQRTLLRGQASISECFHLPGGIISTPLGMLL